MNKNSKFIQSYNKLRQKRVAYQGGGGFSWGQNSPMGDMGGIIGMGGGLVDTLNPGDEWGHRSAGGAAASGALKGAAMGAPLGPIGMGVGALIGGVSSFFGQKKQNKKADMAKWRHQSSARMEARNYGQQDMANFAEEGGKLTQLYPRFMQPTKNGMQTIKYYLDGGNLMEEFGPQSIQPGWTHEYFERPSEFNMRPGYQQFKSGGFGAVFRGGSSPGYMASQGGNHNQGHFGDTAGGGRANMLFLTRDPKTNIWAKQAAPGDFQRKWGYQGFKQGGKKVPGGEVNQLSDRAVEFEGNNPQATDAINIGDNTFVDHNEAMVQTPEGEIVASDSVFLGGGKRSVASHVKSLQSRKSKSRSPEKRGFYDYRTDVALAQQELEAGRVDPKQVLAIAEPGGEQMRHGGIGDKDPNFHPPTADSINFAGGGSVFGDGRDENFLNVDFSKRPGSQMYYEYGGLYAGNNPVDETEFFNLQNLPDQRKKKRKLNLRDGGLVINDDIMGRVAQYCKGGRYARKMNEGGKMEDDDDYLDKLAENKSEAMEEQLEMGIPTEAKEHKTSMKKGRRIAKDHLEEDKKYYTKLKKAGLQEGGIVPQDATTVARSKKQKLAEDVGMDQLTLDQDLSQMPEFKRAQQRDELEGTRLLPIGGVQESAFIRKEALDEFNRPAHQEDAAHRLLGTHWSQQHAAERAEMQRENERMAAQRRYRDRRNQEVAGGYQPPSMSEEEFIQAGYDKGGSLSEPIFEHGEYSKELKTEPGHGPHDATFMSGGLGYFDDRAKRFKKGGKSGIYIKPSKRGTFTAAAKKHGHGVQEHASHVLANKEDFSPAMVKKANFAKNASKWGHASGGKKKYQDGGGKGYSAGNYLDSLSNANAVQGTELPFDWTPPGLDSLSAMYPVQGVGQSLERQGAFMPQPQGLGYRPTGTVPADSLFTSPIPFGAPNAPMMNTLGDINQEMPALRFGRGTLGPQYGNVPQGGQVLSDLEWQARQRQGATTGGGAGGVGAATAGATIGGAAGAAGGAGTEAPATETIPQWQVPPELQAIAGHPGGPGFNPVEAFRDQFGVTGMGGVPGTGEVLAGAGAAAQARMDAAMANLPQAQRGRGLDRFLKGAATFGPDVLNTLNYLTTPTPRSPVLQRPVNLRRMNNRAQQAQIAEASRSANKAILGQGSQFGATANAINAAQANKLRAIGQSNEALRNMNAAIRNREALINSRINALNTGLRNKFQEDQLSRQLMIRRGLAQTAAGIGEKGQRLFAERDMKAKDRLALEAMRAASTSGVHDRKLLDLLTQNMANRYFRTD